MPELDLRERTCLPDTATATTVLLVLPVPSLLLAPAPVSPPVRRTGPPLALATRLVLDITRRARLASSSALESAPQEALAATTESRTTLPLTTELVRVPPVSELAPLVSVPLVLLATDRTERTTRPARPISTARPSLTSTEAVSLVELN